MGNPLQAVMKKKKSLIRYTLFGCITVAVDWLVYFAMYEWLGQSATVSNVASWFGAVLAAFLSNKPFVFDSHDWSGRVVGPEFTKFLSGRFGSLVLQTALMALTVDYLRWDSTLMKILTTVLVVAINFVVSYLVVFKNVKE